MNFSAILVLSLAGLGVQRRPSKTAHLSGKFDLASLSFNNGTSQNPSGGAVLSQKASQAGTHVTAFFARRVMSVL